MNRTQRLNERVELFHLLSQPEPWAPNGLMLSHYFASKASHNEILAASYVNPLIPVRAGWNPYSGYHSGTRMPNKHYPISSVLPSLFYCGESELLVLASYVCQCWESTRTDQTHGPSIPGCYLWWRAAVCIHCTYSDCTLPACDNS